MDLVNACFLYRRECDDMLIVHNQDTKFSGPPDCEYYEFNDYTILHYAQNTMPEDEFEKLNALFKHGFPKHLGNFVRNHVEKNRTIDFMDRLLKHDYTAADEMIHNALKAYTELTLKQRIKLHMKELDKIRKQLRRESRIRLS
jgi:hypothetical protein